MLAACCWLLVNAELVNTLSSHQHEASFLRADSVLSSSPIATSPRGLPLDTHDASGHSAQKAETRESLHGHESRSGHHHEVSEHHSEPPESHRQAESLSLAYMLMAAVGSLMIVFHLAHSKYDGVKYVTWRVLNMTLSIFSAVLLYGTFWNLMEHFVEPTAGNAFALSCMVFVFLYVGTHIVMYNCKGQDEVHLQAAAQLLGHICAFAAMYGFADSHEEIEMFAEAGVLGMVLCILLSGAIIAGTGLAMGGVMQKFALESTPRGRRSLDEYEVIWLDACEETDDDVFCLTVSFLTVLMIRSLIRGGAPQPYAPGGITGISQRDCNVLLACSLSAFTLLGVGTFVANRNRHNMPHHSRGRRVGTIIQHLSSMICAWSLLFWVEWQLYVIGWEHTVIGGCIAIAIFLTVWCFLCVFMLNFIVHHFRDSKLMKRVLQSIELALGVLMGFSWERAFDVGFEEIEHNLVHNLGHGPSQGIIISAIGSLILFLIVASAWRMHVLPKVLKGSKEHEVYRILGASVPLEPPSRPH